jgi:hypothetical protein
LRGWRWSDLGFRVTPRRALAGVALWFTGESLMAIVWLWELVLFGDVPAGWDERPSPTPAGAARSLLALLLVATVNPHPASVYARWRQVFPIVFAHGLANVA